MAPNLQIFVINFRNICPSKPFKPGLMFAGKARAYLSEAPVRYSTLWYTPSLTHKQKTILENLEW